MESYRTRARKLAAAAAKLKEKTSSELRRPAPASLVFMTDRRRLPAAPLVARALPDGSAIILRDYDASDRRGLARHLRAITSARNILLLVGADPRLAADVGADGVHFPSWMRARPRPNGATLFTRACHNANELRAGKDADMVLLSPVFATASHPNAETLGADRFKALAATAPAPVIALGGVDEMNARLVQGANVAGLAAIGAFAPR